MKHSAKIFLIITGLALVVSCDQWMGLIPPQGLIREEFWQSKEDVEAMLMGAYDTFGNMNGNLLLYGELRGDMIRPDYGLGNDARQISESTIYEDNGMCNWRSFYEVINFCNEVMKNAPLVKEIDETFTEYQLNGFLAEAIYLRSLTYFYLVRIFKDVPYVTEPTETDESEVYPVKSTDTEIIGYLLEDLETYRPFATTDGYQTIEEIKGRATKAAFDALMADINLWIFDYEEVLRHVAKIEANKDLVILSEDEYFDLFYPGNSIESIFEIQFNDEKGQPNGLYGLTNYFSNNLDPSEAAIQMFAAKNGEEPVRGEGFSIKKEGEDDYIIWKYVGRAPDGETARASSEQRSANFIIYRLADVLMMKAEALSQLERYTEAREIFNGGSSYKYFYELTDRAGINDFTAADTPASFEDAILDQRARELAFEGKRWFDLMRMGRRNNYQRKLKFIEIAVQNAPSTQKRILRTKLTNPLGWYLPIHEDELERNKNLEQNTYYNF
ncbi:MAG: RagB/SusD family nutrient uptake outer membrane protein [Bacteroidales bacterium]|nr:RagB/SusD family nutrient uptake outer membrane protein [Bacteroidales bacterium]